MNYVRYKDDCWKLALTEEDFQKCPTDSGQVWKYKVEKRGQGNMWLDAEDGLQVICAPGNSLNLKMR